MRPQPTPTDICETHDEHAPSKYEAMPLPGPRTLSPSTVRDRLRFVHQETPSKVVAPTDPSLLQLQKAFLDQGCADDEERTEECRNHPYVLRNQRASKNPLGIVERDG